MKITKTSKKVYTITAVTCAVAVLAVAGAVWKISSTSKINEALNLGSKHLADMNYNMAIRSYSDALTINPASEDALQGLALSYSGRGDYEKADQIYKEELGGTKDVTIRENHVTLLETIEDYTGAMEALDKLIELEDDDRYYDQKAQIMEKLMSKHQRHDYASADTHTVKIDGGAVLASGNNILGALASDNHLKENIVLESEVDTAFPGTAKTVYAWKNVTAVIDSNGSLWMAGNNRSSQRGTGTAKINPESGWVDTGLSGITKVAGSSATTFALDANGRLWHSGQGTLTQWNDGWQQYNIGETVADIECNGRTLSVLTSGGNLYWQHITDSYSASTLELLTENAVAISQDGYNAWVEGYSAVGSEDGRVDFPDEWAVEYNNYNGALAQTPFVPKDVAVMQAERGMAMYVLDAEGKLYNIYNNSCKEVEVGGTVTAIYTTQSKCVAELENGYVLLDPYGSKM